MCSPGRLPILGWTVIDCDYSCSATPLALVRVFLPQRRVGQIREDGGFCREPVASELARLNASCPREQAQVRGTDSGSVRRLAQRQQVVRGAALDWDPWTTGVYVRGPQASKPLYTRWRWSRGDGDRPLSRHDAIRRWNGQVAIGSRPRNPRPAAARPDCPNGD